MVYCVNGYTKIVESRLIFFPKPDDTQSLLSTYFDYFINRQIILK